MKVTLHSTDDASCLAALLLSRILPVFSLVTPCIGPAQLRPSGVSVQRATFITGS